MKRLLIALILAIAIVMSIAVPAMAAGPETTTTINWSGGGLITGTVDSGASTTTFGVNAGASNGVFTATDNNDNPYNYGVDTQSAYITGTVENGLMEFQTIRNTSKEAMYGPAGQTVYAFVGATGVGTMATGSWTNFAEMTNGTYNKPLVNGHNFTATGLYTIQQYVGQTDASISGNYANLLANGNGSAEIDCMTTGAYGSGAVKLGWGGGCFTNADAVFTGSGSFMVEAAGDNGLTTPIAGANGAMTAGGWAASGVSSLQTILNFTAGASVGNYSVAVW